MTNPTFGQMIKGIDLLVRQGRAEYVTIDGKPGLRLIKRASPTNDILQTPEIGAFDAKAATKVRSE